MELDIICLQFEKPQLVWLQHCLGVFWLKSQQPLPNFLQVYKTPCWTFCKLLGLAYCYQPFLYSIGNDIRICLVSFPYDIHVYHYPTYGLLYVEFRFVFVFARTVRHCLWYRASRAVISPIAYFANNTWFWSRVAISHSLLSDWIVLDLDTLPSNLSQMKHVFSGAIDVANLDRVFHWLWHSYLSLCLHLLALSSVKVQVNKLCAMMLNGSLIQPQCLPHHLTGMGQCPEVVKRFKETAWYFK